MPGKRDMLAEVRARLDELAQRGIAVWYRQLLPHAIGAAVREPDLPPVYVMDADALLHPRLHCNLLEMLCVLDERRRPGEDFLAIDAEWAGYLRTAPLERRRRWAGS